MNMKTMMVAFAAFTAAIAAAEMPEVTAATMRQATTSRLVTIEYTLINAPAVVTLEVQTNANPSAAADDSGWTPIGGEAVCNAQGDVWKRVGESGTFNGTITWRPDKSWPGFKIPANGARAIVTAWPLDNTPDYMVVDITSTAATNSQCYYPSVDYLPGGILSNQNYRTSTIVMRKIMAKDVTWTMGSTTLETQRKVDREATHRVTLTNNYYIGVFPVTQAQWDLIQPSRTAPSYFSNPADRAMRPVEQVCYNEIRNAANSTTANTDYDWPTDPNPSSLLGKLRTKTGIDFDLPSEAQWEFAARAGNGDTKWGDSSGILNSDADANLDKLGRYQRNGGQVLSGSSYANPAPSCGATNGTAIVGSYAPNDWGLYDTAGNVWEWCLDWYAVDITALNGAVNTTSGGNRVKRGGCWNSTAGSCRPAYRDSGDPSGRGPSGGFRLVCTAGLQ